MPNRTKRPEVVERGPIYKNWDGEPHNIIHELNALGACAKRAG